MSELWRKLLFLFRRGCFDRELDEEMQFHLEMKARRNREAGVPADEADYAARRKFGNALLMRESSRDAWGWGFLESLAQDVSYAPRMLRKNPGFTAVAALSLALGIGANTALFSLMDAMLFRWLPVKNPKELVLASRAIRSVLFGLSPTDPVTLAAALAVLAAVTAPACSIPARRATKVDPMEALRYE